MVVFLTGGLGGVRRKVTVFGLLIRGLIPRGVADLPCTVDSKPLGHGD